MLYWFCSGKSMGVYFMLLLFLTPFADAQELEISLNKSDPFSLQLSQSNIPTTGTLQIVALRVEFQPDDNRFTSGTGIFGPGSIPYLEDPGTNIDPLPHDKDYFEAHLEFVKNYFNRVSGNQLDIQYEVLPDIVRLDHEMAHYSPIGEDPDFEPLALMAQEAWQKLDQAGGFDTSEYDPETTAFVLFHAGVGRDIELTGTTLDKTPQDIPSLYLGRDALSRLLNDPAFNGFPINNEEFRISNTIILPRTLSRRGTDITDDPFVLSLSINGMIAAQIGSHLGLPDLFNTENGRSGIGQFGLMDGAGIFAYNGLFPPEPSAWEKIYLGWETPFDIQYNRESPVSLPAVALKQPESIARVRLSMDEYFLIENRHRDPDGDGVTLTIRRTDGTIEEQTFTNQDERFINRELNFDELLEPGVLIDVSNFDFALPGGFDPGGNEQEERELNGGILIWHIDEGLIRRTIDDNRINADPKHRGVELKEADGAQDIGRPTQIGLTDNNPNGWAFDFWWNGNNATVVSQTGRIQLYENRFGPDTTPNNNSHSGAPSFFELYDFSDNLPTASFSIRDVSPYPDLYRKTHSIDNLPYDFSTPNSENYWSQFPLSAIPFSTGSQNMVLIPARDQILFYDLNEATLLDPGISQPSLQQPFTDPSNGYFTIAAIPSDPLNVTLYQWEESDITVEWEFESPENRGFVSSPSQGILQFDGTSALAMIGTQSVDFNQYPENRYSTEEINGFHSYLSENGELTVITPQETYSSSVNFNTGQSDRLHVGLIEQENQTFTTFVLTDRQLILYRVENNHLREQVIFDSESIEWPALVDFSLDGRPDLMIVDKTRNQLTAKNSNGAVLNYFPIHAPAGIEFTGTPLIADINGNGNMEVIVIGQDTTSMNLFAYNNRGVLLDGFPLLVGGVTDLNDQPIHPALINRHLVAVSHNGDFRVWEFPNLQTILWSARYGNTGNNKVTGLGHQSDISTPEFGILNRTETYNWPNPARDETNLRFQMNEPGEVHIKITTLSGRLIYNRTLEASGGSPEEILINTSSWASGGYLAVVTARVNGNEERKVVKIGIVK